MRCSELYKLKCGQTLYNIYNGNKVIVSDIIYDESHYIAALEIIDKKIHIEDVEYILKTYKLWQITN